MATWVWKLGSVYPINTSNHFPTVCHIPWHNHNSLVRLLTTVKKDYKLHPIFCNVRYYFNFVSTPSVVFWLVPRSDSCPVKAEIPCFAVPPLRYVLISSARWSKLIRRRIKNKFRHIGSMSVCWTVTVLIHLITAKLVSGCFSRSTAWKSLFFVLIFLHTWMPPLSSLQRPYVVSRLSKLKLDCDSACRCGWKRWDCSTRHINLDVGDAIS